MGYIHAFRNTFVVDVLEHLKIVHLDSNFRPQSERTDEPGSDSSGNNSPLSSESSVNKDEEASLGTPTNNHSPDHSPDTATSSRDNETKETSEGPHVPEAALPVPPLSQVNKELSANSIDHRDSNIDADAPVPYHGEESDHEPRRLSRRSSRSSNFDFEHMRKELSRSVTSFGMHSTTAIQRRDPFLVDWNGPDDPEKPTNWSTGKKSIVSVIIMILTAATYAGSSIYTPGQQMIQDEFHVGHVVATLNLSLFVLGYGIGPIFFSPLSEEATIGRLYLYLITLALFVVLQIPAALTRNIGGLITVRFITGVLCSPSLATGGATLGDMINPQFLPLLIGVWAIGAVAAPALAPILGAAMTVAKGWRYIFWLLMAICGGCLLFFMFFFPETLPDNILHRRANRIRRETGDKRYYTLKEREHEHRRIAPLLREVLWRPFALILSEPGILAFDLYIAIAYACFYLFFEAYPIVFVRLYHFTIVEFGLAFLGFIVGSFFAYSVLVIFLVTVAKPRFEKQTFVPEDFLILAMWVCFLLPAALFLFAWTAQVHWILPIVWELLFVVSLFNIFQASFAYLSMSYPRYIASVFAGNAFMRSCFACAFPLFGQAMYDNTATPRFPVGWGGSIVAFITLALALIPFVMYRFGPQLRGHSKYAN